MQAPGNVEQKKIYAVITGDLVKSTSLGAGRVGVLNLVKETLAYTKNFEKSEHEFILSSGIFRGDAFQLLVSDYLKALRVAIYIQAALACKGGGQRYEARLALGLGTIELLQPDSIAESYGEAFLLSGRSLDRIENYRRLILQTPVPDLNTHLGALAACLDAIIQHWTAEQAEAITLWLEGYTQQTIASRLKISQPAVQQRLQNAGTYALKAGLEYYTWLLTNRFYPS